MNLIDKDALIESLGIETDCYDCEHERMKYHCDLDPVEACTKIVEAPVITVTTESAEKAIEVLKNAAWLGAVYSFEETEEAVKTAIRALQVASAQHNVHDFPKDADCISRQAAIDALHMHLMYRMGTDSNKKRLDDWINSLPSAQPEVETQMSLADCISRQDALDAIDRITRTDNWQAAVSMALLDLPSAQPEIIRCKDCKWYGRVDKRRFYRGMDCLQKRIDTIVPDKDFCSRAERRTDE